MNTAKRINNQKVLRVDPYLSPTTDHLSDASRKYNTLFNYLASLKAQLKTIKLQRKLAEGTNVPSGQQSMNRVLQLLKFTLFETYHTVFLVLKIASFVLQRLIPHSK